MSGKRASVSGSTVRWRDRGWPGAITATISSFSTGATSRSGPDTGSVSSARSTSWERSSLSVVSALTETTRSSTPGNCRRYFLSSGGRMCMHTVMPPASVSVPRFSSWVSEIWPTTSCMSRWTRWARRSSSSPGGVGQRALPAVQQPAAQLVLQQLDLAADGGLGDVEALRRAGEAALLGHGPEHLELAHVHVMTPRYERHSSDASGRYARNAWTIPLF